MSTALSDDGRHGLTVIAFVGSVFSPYYALVRPRRPAEPLRRQRGALRPARSLGDDRAGPRRRRPLREPVFAVGPSSLDWDGQALTIPGRRDRGSAAGAAARHDPAGADRAHGAQLRRSTPPGAATTGGRSLRRGACPCGWKRPDLAWDGTATLTPTRGARIRWRPGFADLDLVAGAPAGGPGPRPGGGDPLRAAAARRQRPRTRAPGSTGRAGSTHSIRHRRRSCPATFWRVPRTTPVDWCCPGGRRPWRIAPFYARSVVEQRLFGQTVAAGCAREPDRSTGSPPRWVKLLLPLPHAAAGVRSTAAGRVAPRATRWIIRACRKLKLHHEK